MSKTKTTENVDVRIERAKKLSEFKKSLDGLNKKELETKEQEIIKEAEEVNKKVLETKFTLPNDNFKDAFKAIRSLLSNVKVQWQYASAMADMYEFWSDSKESAGEVEYGLLDATLRQLGGMEFTGYDEWCAVSAINAYFEPIKAQYIETSQSIYDVADKHNAIMEKLDAYNAINEPIKSGDADAPTKE